MNPFLQIIIGYLLADLFTGFFHWLEDTYLDYDCEIPILKDLAKHNEIHHFFPRTIVGYSYWENITTTAPFIFLLYLLIYIFNQKTLYNYPYLHATFFLFTTFTNVIHKWTHMRECELHPIIRFLQKTGILCSHSIHRMHHAENNSTNYCVNSSFLNDILDTIGFWRSFEYIIELVLNIKPNRKGLYDDYKEIHTYMHENAKKDCPDVPTKTEINELIEILDNYMENKKNI